MWVMTRATPWVTNADASLYSVFVQALKGRHGPGRAPIAGKNFRTSPGLTVTPFQG